MNIFKCTISFLLFAQIFLFSCKQKTDAENMHSRNGIDSTLIQKEERESTINDTPPVQEIIYQTITNSRYHFTFEIPNSWNAKSSSENGDGFFIDSGNKAIDFRIYASTLTGVEEIDAMEIECDAISTYTFKDGTIGKKCTYNSILYFYYESKKIRIIFYLDASIEWKKENINAINHIAESISLKKQV